MFRGRGIYVKNKYSISMEKVKTSYEEYHSKIIKIDDFKDVINAARDEYGITAIDRKDPYTGNDIPLNLERGYVDALIDLKDFDTAERVLERMKKSYRGVEAENLLESYEYRFKLIKKTESLFESEKLKLKQELNQHNIATISIVVGVITIFGVANQTLLPKTFYEGMISFIAIVSAICILTAGSFFLNSHFSHKRNH